jgi:hypothetical protein
MLEYTLLLEGLERRHPGLPGALLRDLLDAVDQGARGAVRLRLEGRSRGRGGVPPVWVTEAAAFTFVRLIDDVPGVRLQMPTLGEVLPERFRQHELFPAVDPSLSALSLMGSSLTEAMEGNTESDAFDEPLLATFEEEFRQVFRHGVARVVIRNGRPGSPAVTVTPGGINVVARLKRETPRPRRVRLAGKIDAIRHSDRAFTLLLRSGVQIRGVLAEGDPEALAEHFGRIAVVSASAYFRPSGSLLRVEADHVSPGSEEDLTMWSSVPEPLDLSPDVRLARQPQGPRSGINAIFGKWPGDETEEEFFRMVEEIS